MISIAKRLVSYVFGLLLLAFGVTFAVNSNLGISPTTSVPYGISLTADISMSTAIIIVFSSYILIQILLLRREFNPVNLLQLVFSTIFGYFTGFTNYLLNGFSIPTYLGQLAGLGISIIFVSLGLVFYLTPKLVPMPMEGMTLAIHKKLPQFSFHTVKICVDCTGVIATILITLIGTGTVVGVREGTIIAALVTGKVMGVLMKLLGSVVHRFCFGANAEQPLDPEVEELEQDVEQESAAPILEIDESVRDSRHEQTKEMQ